MNLFQQGSTGQKYQIVNFSQSIVRFAKRVADPGALPLIY
jgi:hypothetical protein